MEQKIKKMMLEEELSVIKPKVSDPKEIEERQALHKKYVENMGF